MTSGALRGWTSAQKHVVAASFLGWMLDAFDFFLLVFVLPDAAKTFAIPVAPKPLAFDAHYAVATGVLAKAAILAPAMWDRFVGSLTGSAGVDATILLTLTLAVRPIGAFIFGRLADRYGRRPVLMFDVLCYSTLAFASAFAPSFAVFLVLRILFGIAMGGEWGVGASLTMESIRPESRGVVSGILQSGYASGYLVASIAFGVLYPIIGWRGMFMVGAVPALLVLYIRRSVPESPGWNEAHAKSAGVGTILKRHWRLALYMILLMTSLNFLSHGTQDLYPTFLRKELKFDPHTVSFIAIIYNLGAIAGGLVFGFFSQAFGRRRALVTAALLSIPVVPLWAFSHDVAILAAAGFAMQFMVQGCWGVIPAHLNEMSPGEARGTFPGFVYQLGNFLASTNATIQGVLAAAAGGEFSYALAGVAVAAALAIALFASLGTEARDIEMKILPREAGEGDRA
jgi:SHS family lactate transporter-like MFS transporter